MAPSPSILPCFKKNCEGTGLGQYNIMVYPVLMMFPYRMLLQCQLLCHGRVCNHFLPPVSVPASLLLFHFPATSSVEIVVHGPGTLNHAHVGDPCGFSSDQPAPAVVAIEGVNQYLEDLIVFPSLILPFAYIHTQSFKKLQQKFNA